MSIIDEIKTLLEKHDTITQTECETIFRLLKNKLESDPIVQKRGPCLICGKFEIDYKIYYQHEKSGTRWINKAKRIIHLTNLIHDRNGLKYKNDFGQIHLKTAMGYFCSNCQKDMKLIAKELRDKYKKEKSEQDQLSKEVLNAFYEQKLKNQMEVFSDESNKIYQRFNALFDIISEKEADDLKNLKYSDFLQTKYWDVVRRQKMKRANFKCELCNSNGKSLNVHHKTYDNHGMEHRYLEDLIVLCRKCHAKFHDKLES